jgi:ketosteroid isomerase-like protein
MTNVEPRTALLAAFNDNDLETGRSLCHPDVTYTIRGHGPFAGTFLGLEELANALQAIRKATGNTMTAEPEVIVSSDDHVMAYMRVHGSRPDGRTYDSHQAYLYRFTDGLLSEGQGIPVDQKAFDEFTSG